MSDEPPENRKTYAYMEFFITTSDEGSWIIEMGCDCAHCKYNVIFALKRALEKLESRRLN